MDDLDALSGRLRRELPPFPEGLQNRQLQRLLLDARARTARPRGARPWAWAVLSVAVVALALVLWPALHAPTPRVGAPVQLAATSSELRRALADGTSIRLQPGALGKLQDSGSAGVRFELQRGRGDFSVKPDRRRVFSVSAGPYDVQVLGTEFSVSYESAGLISVAVTRGVVSVRAAGQPPVQLAAGDRLTGGNGELAIVRADLAQGTSSAASLAAADLAVTSHSEPESPVASPSAPAAAPSWRELYQRRDYPGAAAAARSAGLSGLVERLGAGELADLADAARLGGDLPAARLALQALERRFPRSAQARTAGFLMGRVLAQTGQRAEAIAAFERYLALDPNGVYGLEAMGRLMELHGASGNIGPARTLAERYLERAPSGPYQRLARSLAMRR